MKQSFIEQTRALWSERAGRPVTDEEAREIISNMTEFARILIDWYMADREAADHSSEESNTSPAAPPSCRE